MAINADASPARALRHVRMSWQMQTFYMLSAKLKEENTQRRGLCWAALTSSKGIRAVYMGSGSIGRGHYGGLATSTLSLWMPAGRCKRRYRRNLNVHAVRQPAAASRPCACLRRLPDSPSRETVSEEAPKKSWQLTVIGMCPKAQGPGCSKQPAYARDPVTCHDICPRTMSASLHTRTGTLEGPKVALRAAS